VDDDIGRTGEFEDDVLEVAFPRIYDAAAWGNVCDDFLDPLAEELGEWVSRRPVADTGGMDVVEWFEELTYIMMPFAHVVGSQDITDRWNRARVEMVLYGSPEFPAHFQAEAKRMLDATEAALKEFSNCRPTYARFVVDGFLAVEVEEFRSYLRSCSLTLRQRLRHEAETSDETEQRRASRPKPKAKNRRGRPKKTDPTADKRVWDAKKTGQYKGFEDLAAALGLEVEDVRRALDRHRKRLGKPGNKSSD